MFILHDVLNQGAAAVHFQDFNAEVLRLLTIPNVKANLVGESSKIETDISSDVRFFSGDWSEIHQLLLPRYSNDKKEVTDDSSYDGYDVVLMAETVYELSSLSSLYDLIKKVSINQNISLFNSVAILIWWKGVLKCLFKPSGVVYMAGKKHYFGVGGGTRQFLHVIEEDGKLNDMLIAHCVCIISTFFMC